ncbi:MAG: cytidine deaminase [Paludibacteraceae bacterium]|nr:cytidine deaminase [Paludibacteraceae bacterium]
MEKKNIQCNVTILSYDELDKKDAELVEKAKQATSGSYSPYSQFSVGTAIRLADGTIVTGSNQENASYPCGLCAERTALFYANAQYPTLPVNAIAIAAKNVNGFLSTPITPCGACRQALLETELRYKQMIKVLLYGTEKIYCVNSIAELLPLQFTLS